VHPSVMLQITMLVWSVEGKLKVSLAKPNRL
jgi:hypothetical protein